MGYSVPKLADLAEISEGSVRNIERGKNYRRGPREDCIERIADVFGISVKNLLAGKRGHHTQGMLPSKFSIVSKICDEVDLVVGPAILDLSLADHKINGVYVALLEGRLRQHRVSLRNLIARMNQRSWWARAVSSVEPPQIEISIDLNTKQEIIRFDNEKLVVDDPLLLWPCYCYLPKTACPIHSRARGARGDWLHRLFSRCTVLIRCEECQFLWRDCGKLPPPSIETLSFFSDLQAEGIFKRKIDSLLDLGSGTGCLGILATTTNRGIRRIELGDWRLSAALYGGLNWMRNSTRAKQRPEFAIRVGLNTHWINPGKFARYDAVVCNPPFLPNFDRPNFADDTDIIVGTKLLIHVIRSARTIGRRVYVQISHLALDEANRAASDAGVRLKLIGKERSLPFATRLAFKQPHYLQRLKRKRKPDYVNDGRFRWRFKVSVNAG